jgi:hypothetical protein
VFTDRRIETAVLLLFACIRCRENVYGHSFIVIEMAHMSHYAAIINMSNETWNSTPSLTRNETLLSSHLVADVNEDLFLVTGI